MRRSRTFLAVAACALALSSLAASQNSPSLPLHPSTAVTGVSLLTQPIPDSAANAAQLRLGQSLVIQGDCMSCHLRPGGEPLAGGLGLNTPFGVIYSPNITSDEKTGIGGWTPDQFYRAMHEGVDDQNANLYPAFPYPWFTRVSRADSDAILAYLKTTPAVSYTAPANKLPFPLNLRVMVKVWNLLFFKTADVQPVAGQSAEWNRGAQIVQGLGHCSDCHTPKNFLGGERAHHPFRGGQLDNWVAPDLTGNGRTGLGAWSVDDIAEFLKTGRNAHAGAGGSMADVVTYSTSLMTDADRHAVGVYLKSLPASPDASPAAPEAAAMTAGAEVYSDACASCHLANGVGQPTLFPPLPRDAMAQQADPTGVIHLILAGARTAPTPTRPSPLSMPSFAWKLTDQQVADVATYVRNSWGNKAAPVSASKVAELRKKLDLKTSRPTVNSTDRS